MKKIILLFSLVFIAMSTNAQTIQYTYDKLGRIIQEVYPDSNITTYTYDAVGNRLTERIINTCFDRPNPIITYSTPLTFCQGDSVILTAPTALKYKWSRGDTTKGIVVKISGTYTVTTTGTLNCLKTSAPITVKVNSLPSLNKSQVNVLCYGNSSGSIDLSVDSSIITYSYNWTAISGGSVPSGQTTDEDLNGLVAGKYRVTVTDANGCTSDQSFTISEPTQLVAGNAGQTEVLCFGGSTVIATVSATGGTMPYSYSWSNGGTSAMNTGLAPGSYTATVTDANGCTSTQAFTITQPTQIVVTSTGQSNVNCFGLSNGAASVSVSGGTGAYSYDWTPGTPSGDGTASVSSLTAGMYTVTVTDANSCIGTMTFDITQPAPGPDINVLGNSTSIADGDATPSTSDSTDFGFITTISSTVTYTIQNDGATDLTVSGISLTGADASEYALGGISFPATIPASSSTTFTVTFTPTAKGVKTATVNIASNDCDESAYDFAMEGEGCPGGTITPAPTNDGKYTGGYTNHIYLGYGAQVDTLKATGFGSGSITWTGSATSMLHCTTCPSPNFTPTAEGNYTFTATSGCRTKDILICVKNVYHSGSGINTLIRVCHQSNSGPQTFAISLRNVNQHIAGHAGDELGDCGNTCGNLKRNVDVTEIIVDQDDLEITCTPNPFNQSFRLHYVSTSDDESTIMIYGMTGNLIESIHSSGCTNEILLGNNLPAGIYAVSFVQGSNKRTFRMIKIN